ncbi:hypothetical protein SERVES_01681 [Serratia ficaria]|uniref:hypothetical protein n=1 Tax=Serratia ficaria TaxID=61651 RepID=UPI001199FD08|nr:hypothetical protein [Serratia ficaria]VVA47960.1 hypothetical protein SERVES_01681 [Serratia ficaria]
MSKLTKIFVTKYALSTGIFSAEAERRDGSDMAIIRVDRSSGYFDMYLHKGDFHLDEESALRKAQEMRQKKIASLHKQLAKLEKLKFEVKHGQ